MYSSNCTDSNDNLFCEVSSFLWCLLVRQSAHTGEDSGEGTLVSIFLELSHAFDVGRSVHHHTIQIN
jgi:hypothetical protein